MKKIVFVKDINIKGSPVVRDRINKDVVEDYAEKYRSKQKMPDIRLVHDENAGEYLIADGMHRLSAMTSIGKKAVPAEVTKGTYEDALKVALTANVAHGLRRSNEDKWRCAKAALLQWPDHSNGRLAEAAGVSDKFIAAVREQMEKNKSIAKVTERKGKDERTTKTDSIGSTPNRSESKEKSKDALKDKTGWPIPEPLAILWHRNIEVDQLLDTLQEVKRHIAKAQKSEDVMYAEVNHSAVISDLEKSIAGLEVAKAHAVCTQCQGNPDTQPKKECRLCKSKGLISKFRFDRVVPEEIKKVRAKAVVK